MSAEQILTHPNHTTLEQIISYCKSKGYIFPSSDIYGGIKGFFDYGHVGVQLKKNIIDSYFSNFVWRNENIIAQDGSIISNPNVWKASGHVDMFDDPVLITENGKKERADHFIEETLKIPADGMSTNEIFKLIKDNNLTFEGEKVIGIEKMNLMFSTKISKISVDKKTSSPESLNETKIREIAFDLWKKRGCPIGSPDIDWKKAQTMLEESTNNHKHQKQQENKHQNDSDNIAYLRPETCQNIFCNAKYLAEINRLALPFGIVQVGKVFRNEIAPRNFIFRCREFEQIEMEYFYNPNKECPGLLTDEHLNFNVDCKFSSNVTENIQLSELKNRQLVNDYHLYWISEMLMWLVNIVGLDKTNLRIREHCKEELSHYSSATFDIDFKYPFGDASEFKELCGIANRGCYDISQHAKFSKSNLLFFDESTKEKLYPNVIEPSIGVERLFLAVLCNGYRFDTTREYIVMNIQPQLCSFEYAILPLVNKFNVKGREVYNHFVKKGKRVFYDKGGAIGRRYARQDEIGTKWCITIDGQTSEDDTVTIRDRDTTVQVRIKYSEIF